MPISWNEIRQNAIRFSREWAGEAREDAEAKSFWDEFFTVFGMRRRTVASFEDPVLKTNGSYGYIDLFWHGVLLVEHKSRGKSLDKAESQAFSYIQDLAREGRHDDLPRYIILSDFDKIALYDLEPENQLNLPLFEAREYYKVEFKVAELHKHIHEFAFIAGYKQHRIREEDPINIKAVEILGALHDALAEEGYAGHELERFLVRILFCLFAEDTGLFEPKAFTLYIENRTAADGSDLGMHLARLFETLDNPAEQRQKNLEELLAAFPYVNGALFAERLRFADFNRAMRDALLVCTSFDWSRISPAIFGSLFQGVMEAKERRQTGGHYTSERDILKLINALFMDDLRAEFEKAKRSKTALKTFQQKLGSLRFFDPACGCGNFLVITYRELRLLEIEVLKAMYGDDVQMELDVQALSIVDVDAYTGIEIQEWPARIAEVAMWLMDHQMNMRLSEAFGQYFVRLPLRKSANINVGNALRLDWKTILSPDQCAYVLGNPPFVGKQFQDSEQKKDMELIWAKVKGAGVLDYVTCWYAKAADYIQNTAISVGFVSTNSISQGEQVGLLWNDLFQRNMKIQFAYRTFPWASEARGKAHVHVVIIGFVGFNPPVKTIYECVDEKISRHDARNISPYLIEGNDAVVMSRTTALCQAPEIGFGSMPNDGGNLILSENDRRELISQETAASQFIRPFLGPDEFLNNTPRWCLWLVNASPAIIRSCPLILSRIEDVRTHRQKSKRKTTQELADKPSVFGENRQPTRRYLAIPKTTSERRICIPMAFLDPEVIAGTDLFTLPDANVYHFGILTSTMHMAWMRQVCGRLESRYRYSAGLVYNNFPWPENPNEKNKATVEAKAQKILEVRAKQTLSTLADLYDPLTMPPDLVKAHADLDRAVDRCYRSQEFTSDRQRVEFLFALYERYAVPLLPAGKRKRKRADGD
jgi:hypothetical protein